MMVKNRVIIFLSLWSLAFVCPQEIFGAAPSDPVTRAFQKLDAALKKDDVATVAQMINNREIDPLAKSAGRGLYLYQMAEGQDAKDSQRYLKAVFDEEQRFRAFRAGKASEVGMPTAGHGAAIGGKGRPTGRPAIQQRVQVGVLGGAGVLPYAFDAKSNTLYFLLGRDKGGKYAGTWSDFGGGAEAKDRNDPAATAAREFAEETEGLFGDAAAARKLVDQSGEILRQSSLGGKDFVGYLVQVQYIPDVRRRFKAQHEKSEIAWISAEQLFNALENNNPTIGRIMLRPTTLRSYEHSLRKLRALQERFQAAAPAPTAATAGLERGAYRPAAHAERGAGQAEYQVASRGKAGITDEEELLRAIRAGDVAATVDIMSRLEGGTYARIPYVKPGCGEQITDPLEIALFENKQNVIDALEPMRLQQDAQNIINNLAKILHDGGAIDDDADDDIRKFTENINFRGKTSRAEHARLARQINDLVAKIRSKAAPAPRPAGTAAHAGAPGARAAAPSAAKAIGGRPAPAAAVVAGSGRPKESEQQKTERDLQASLNVFRRKKDNFFNQMDDALAQVDSYASGASAFRTEFESILREFTGQTKAGVRAALPAGKTSAETALKKRLEEFSKFSANFLSSINQLSGEIDSYEKQFNVRGSQFGKEFKALYEEVMG